MFDKIKDELIKSIGPNRYNHTLGVVETAIELSLKYNCDVEKAKIASLLHDCAKFADKLYLLKRAKELDIILDNIMSINTELIHGPLGAKLAEVEYGINDIEILDAIRYHTTGREQMTLLDKIIYIADYIEPGRSFQGVEEVRDLAALDIDKAISIAMDNTILFLVKSNKLIHPDTINARNFLLTFS